MFACVCVCERERECVCAHACMRMCVCESLCACEHKKHYRLGDRQTATYRTFLDLNFHHYSSWFINTLAILCDVTNDDAALHDVTRCDFGLVNQLPFHQMVWKRAMAGTRNQLTKGQALRETKMKHPIL